MAKNGPYNPPSVPQGSFTEAPPSYEATVSGAAGGFVDPIQSQPKAVPSLQKQEAPGAHTDETRKAAPTQTKIVNFGYEPVNVTCPHCQFQSQTSMSDPSKLVGILTYALCVGLCFCLYCKVRLWQCAWKLQRR